MLIATSSSVIEFGDFSDGTEIEGERKRVIKKKKEINHAMTDENEIDLVPCHWDRAAVAMVNDTLLLFST